MAPAFDRACQSMLWWMRNSDHPSAPEIAGHYARWVMRMWREQQATGRVA